MGLREGLREGLSDVREGGSEMLEGRRARGAGCCLGRVPGGKNGVGMGEALAFI